jgi:hypothetical protein
MDNIRRRIFFPPISGNEQLVGVDIEFIDHLYPANAAVAARQLQGAATAEVRLRLRQEKSVPLNLSF